jgi:proteasome alpha subunit
VTVPFYVSPEQIIKDKADYARKGIARGRSVVVVQYDDGVLFVAENPSRALHKISEIYDRIAFAAVGKYNEFENLRVAGVRLADLRGYSYDRRDVTGRALANAYAQTLGTIFTDAPKPYEVEIVVAEVGADSSADQLYRLTFDGSVADEHGFVAMGGSAESITVGMRERYREGMSLVDALRLSVDLLGGSADRPVDTPADAPGDGSANGDRSARRVLSAAQLEVAVLDRNRPRRAFRRITGERLTDLLGEPADAQGDKAEKGAASRRSSSSSQAESDNRTDAD